MSITHRGRLDRRRTLRVALSVPLHVRAASDSIDRFNLKTCTLSINSHGALIQLDPEVSVGETLLLVNENSGKAAEARVVSVHRGKDGKNYVGVEFAEENPAFWDMNFPRPGARPLRRFRPVIPDEQPF